MSEIRIASRYAKSLIGLAQEKGILEEVHDDMQAFDEVIKENRALLLALKNPILKPEKKKAILNALFGDVNELTKAFFDIITKKNRADVLPPVASEFHKQYNIIKGIQVAQISTAAPIDADIRDRIISLVKDISGKQNIQLNEKVNDQLIGGFVLTVGDKQIDDSLKTKLNHLRRELTQNQYIKEF
jgi:F-type H+-transporting ATPase subunit delta